ncbi:MAG: leucine-rich repeat protein [Ruminococcus sp.]|nr:leucine-rich repeat protein [Ruminococcus sp.]
MMKTAKRIVSFILVFVLVFSALTVIPGEVLHSWYVSAAELVTGQAGAEETYQSGDYTYTLINEYTNVKITAYNGQDPNLVIPAKIDGKVVSDIAPNVFRSMSFLKTVKLPDSLKTIESRAFEGCTGMTELSLGNSLETIGSWAFHNCPGLTKLTIPASLTKISEEAFYYCTGIQELEIQGTDLAIGNYAFEYLTNLEKLTIHEGVKSIGYAAFSGNKKLKIVSLPDSLETIGASAFNICESIESITLGKGVTSVGENAFYNCISLKTVQVNAACAALPTNAFNNDTALESITVDNNNQKYSSYNGALLDKEKTKVLVYPKSKAGAYTIPNTVTSISAEAFSNCQNLSEITIGDGVTEIGASAFIGCTGLKKVTLGNGVTVICNNAFANCTVLEEVSFGNSLKTIEYNAFRGDIAITGVKLPDSLKTIESRAFEGCTGMTELSLGNSLETIGSWAFHNCPGLTKLTIPASLTKISEEAFYYCTGIQELEIQGTDLAIGNYAFEYLTNLEKLTIHEGVKSIGYAAFVGSKELTTAVFPKSLESITKPLFSEDTAFTAYCYENTPLHEYLKTLENVTVKFITENYFVVDLKVAGLTSGSITLNWKKPNGFDNIDHYNIYKNGEKYDETEKTSYTDKNVQAENDYNYAVSAVDTNGVISEQRTISAVPSTAKISKIILPDNNTGIGGLKPVRLTAKMENSLSKDGARADFIFFDGNSSIIACNAFVQKDGVTYTGDWDLTNVASGEYTLRFQFTDTEGGKTFKDVSVSVDRTHPAKIDGVSLVPQETKISINWILSTESDTQIYRIYRAENDGDFELITEIRDRFINHYEDTKVKKGCVYHYYVVGVDPFNQESLAYNKVSAGLIIDSEKPVINKITPAKNTTIHGMTRFTVYAIDNVGVMKTALYYSANSDAPCDSWNILSEKEGSSFSEDIDTSALPFGDVYLFARVYDAAGNYADSDIYHYICDNEGPDKVKNVKLELNVGTQICLSWSRPEAEDTSYFIVEMKQPDGSYIKFGDPVYYHLYKVITDLTPETNYVFRIVAFDNYNNRGVPSDNFSVKTQKDSLSPNVDNVTSDAKHNGYASDSINFRIEATDDYQLKTVEIQTSNDKKTWKTVKSFDAEHNNKKQAFAHLMDVSAMNEGVLYVRVTAQDVSGNTSLDNETSVLEFHIDRTPCPVPSNVTASSDETYNCIAWDKTDDDSIWGYNVYRADTENGDYISIFKEKQSNTVYDENVTADKEYWYKVQSVDLAGNLSEFSKPVSCRVLPDTEAPVLVGYLPLDRAKISLNANKLNMTVADNFMLSSVKIEYKTNGLFNSYQTLKEINDISVSVSDNDFSLPVDQLNNGDEVTVRFTARDKAGNEMEEKTVVYIIDKEAPGVSNITVDHSDNQNTVTWESNADDAKQFNIFRQTSQEGVFKPLRTVYYENGKSSYSIVDDDLGDETYFKYRIDSYDDVLNCGQFDSDGMEIEKPSWVNAYLDYYNYQVEGKQYIFDASGSSSSTSIVEYRFNFGDGSDTICTTNPIQNHIYYYSGVYDITLEAVDEDNNTSVLFGTVIVESAVVTGHVSVYVTDENGNTVSGAEVYLDGDTTRYYPTNILGFVELDLAPGGHTFAAYKNGYSPKSTQSISVTGGNQTVYLQLKHENVVTCDFTVKKMSFKEIKDAGIDLNNKNNYSNGVLKFDVDIVSDKKPTKTTFYYDGKRVIGDPVYIYNGNERRVLTPMVFENSDSEKPILGLLDTPDMEYTALKDFFDVRLLIYNNASSDYNLTGCTVTLNTDSGLSIVTDAKKSGASTNRTVSLGTIPGQGHAEAKWILRGDKAGKFGLSADFVGTLSYFNRPIIEHFVYNGKITVKESPLEGELQISRTPDSTGKIFYDLIIANISDSAIRIPDGVMNFKESFKDELILSNGSKLPIAKRGTDYLEPGYKVVNHFHTSVKVMEEFKKSVSKTFSAANVNLKITYLDNVHFRESYEDKYPKEAFTFTVKNADNRFVKGAVVDIGSHEFTTNDKGQVYIPADEVEKYSAKYLKVSCPGYVAYTEDDFKGPLNGKGKTIKLYTEKDFDILSVAMNGADVLHTKKELYLGSVESNGDPAVVTFVVRFAGQNAENVSFVQCGNVEIKPSSTSYDRNNNIYTFVTNVRQIRPNTPITLKVYPTVGSQVYKNLLADPVMGDDEDFSDFIKNFINGVPEKSGLNFSDVDLDFLRDLDVNFLINDSQSFGISHNQEDESVVLSFCFTPWGIWGMPGDWDSVPGCDQAVDEMIKWMNAYKNALKNGEKLLQETKITASINLGAAFTFKRAGRSWIPTEARGYLMLYAGVKYQAVIVTPMTLPLTMGIDFSGTIEGDIIFENFTTKQADCRGILSGYFALTPSLAIGIPWLNIGVYATLALDSSIESYHNDIFWRYVKLVGEFGVSATAAMFSYKHKIYDAEKVLYSYDGVGSKSPFDVGALYDENNYLLNNKLSEYSIKWSSPKVINGGTTELLKNVDNSQKPQLVKVGDKTVMVYRAIDKDAGSVANSLALYYSVYDPEKLSWSMPVKLDNNHCSDIDFKLTGNGVTAQVVYSQVNEEVNDDISMLDLFGKTDIYAASFDPNSGRFNAPAKLSDNSVCDALPSVKYINNIPTAVWAQNENNNPFLNDSSNSIMLSSFVNGVWTDPEKAVENVNTLMQLDVIKNGKNTSIVYVTDNDNDLNTADDRSMNIYNSASDSVQTISEECQVGFTTCEINDRESVVWNQNGELILYDVAAGKTLLLCYVSPSATDLQFVSENGEYAIVYLENGNDVKLIRYNNNTRTWSTPVTILTSEKYLEKISADYVDGKLSLTYFETEVLDDKFNTESNLMYTVIDDFSNPVIENVSFDYLNIKACENANLEVKVTNKGTLPTGNLTFNIKNYDDSSLGSVTLENSSLDVGETQTFNVPFTVPEDIYGCDLTVAVKNGNVSLTGENQSGDVGSDGQFTEKGGSGVSANLSDDTTSANIGDRNLTVSENNSDESEESSFKFNLGSCDVKLRAVQYVDDGESLIRAEIKNNTDYETPVTLEVFNRETSEVYYSHNIEEVTSEYPIIMYIPLNESYADKDGIIAVRVVPAAKDFNESNNTDLIAYYDPDMIVGDADLDGRLTINDVTLIQKHLAGYEPKLTGKALYNCDTNKDGKVDINDATRIQIFLSKVIEGNVGYTGMNF